MAISDFYEILGITETASIEEIKQAYRIKAKENHPDVGGNEDDFIKIKEAFDVLSNPQSKHEYDYFYYKYKGYKSGVRNQESQEQPTQNDDQEVSKSNDVSSSEFSDQTTEKEKVSKPLIVIISIIIAIGIISQIQQPSSPTNQADIPNSTFGIQKNENAPTANIPNNDNHSTITTIKSSTSIVEPTEKPSKDQVLDVSPKFTLGSSKEDVINVMGQPDSIERFPSFGDIWRYGYSSVNFDTKGKVEGWSSIMNGKATIGEQKSDFVTFTLGSSKQEVIDALGTPDSIEKFPSFVTNESCFSTIL